jgi:hypothetical protein
MHHNSSLSGTDPDDVWAGPSYGPSPNGGDWNVPAVGKQCVTTCLCPVPTRTMYGWGLLTAPPQMSVIFNLWECLRPPGCRPGWCGCNRCHRSPQWLTCWRCCCSLCCSLYPCGRRPRLSGPSSRTDGISLRRMGNLVAYAQSERTGCTNSGIALQQFFRHPVG